MPIYESVQIRKPNDDGFNATGDLVVTLDENGIRLSPGATLVDSDGTVVASSQSLHIPLTASFADTYIFHPPSGQWQLTDARIAVSIAGGPGARVSLNLCSADQLPTEGTTLLAAPLALEETAPYVRAATIAGTVTFTAGNSLAVSLEGDVTGLVALLVITVKRIS